MIPVPTVLFLELDGINTEAAEQLFSWLKRYAYILSCLGWRRIPLFLLILFHNKNLERTKVRPNKVFDLVSEPNSPNGEK